MSKSFCEEKYMDSRDGNVSHEAAIGPYASRRLRIRGPVRRPVAQPPKRLEQYQGSTTSTATGKWHGKGRRFDAKMNWEGPLRDAYRLPHGVYAAAVDRSGPAAHVFEPARHVRRSKKKKARAARRRRWTGGWRQCGRVTRRTRRCCWWRSGLPEEE